MARRTYNRLTIAVRHPHWFQLLKGFRHAHR